METKVNEKSAKAYVEILEIIKYMEPECVNKIPKGLIEFFERQKDKNYEYHFDEEKDFSEQKISEETGGLLAMLALNYIANEENKEKIEIHTYGINNSSDIIAEKIELGEEKSKFVAKTSSEKVNIDVPVGGEHFVYNALCGFMVGKVLGLSSKEIQDGISKFELTKKRMDIRTLKNGATLINDSYNASYESMKASLKYLSNRTDLRKIAVLGDMLELGEFSKKLHEKVGEEVANNNIDILICRGEFAKDIILKASQNNKTQCILLQNNEEILGKLQEILREGDVVLIKASNGMKFYEICQKL